VTDAKREPLMLSRKSQKRWAFGGCLGCGGFMALALVMALIGFKRSLDPQNIWAQLSAYMDFESPPEGFEPLFVMSFFDQRQIAFYRPEDMTEVILMEYTGRVREGFEDAFDVDNLKESGSLVVEQGTMVLQGREVQTVSFSGGAAAGAMPADAGERKTGLQGKLLKTFGLLPEDPPVFRKDTPILHLRFSGDSDSGGTLLVVRAPTEAPLTQADLEALFVPFDLWSQVDSAPKPPAMPQEKPLELKDY